jgi:DUF4097 and DUF4098 domain-containing protein YvlB
MVKKMVRIHERAGGYKFLMVLFLAAVMGGYAAEVLPLANTQTVGLGGTDTLSISYGSGEVILRESETGDLILKEYMKPDRARYHAVVSRSGGTVTVKQGRRPWFNWSWKARMELFLPPAFRENIRLSIASGSFRSEMDLLDYKSIDIDVGSGSVSGNRLSAAALSILVSSGDLDIQGAGGNSRIRLSSGRLRIAELSGGEHRLTTSSGRMRIDALRGDSVIAVSSGDVVIGALTGNADMEISSGTLQIAELTGTSHRFGVSSGRTTIENVRGRIDGEVSSGALSIENFSGEGSLTLRSGNAALNMEELTGDFRFRLSSGRITMNLPRDVSYNLDVDTNSGSVQVTGDEPTRVSGNSTVLRPFGPSPERTIYARTNSGSITINRR